MMHQYPFSLIGSAPVSGKTETIQILVMVALVEFKYNDTEYKGKFKLTEVLQNIFYHINLSSLMI